jgi:transmembrane 9 superfamily protein 2/4
VVPIPLRLAYGKQTAGLVPGVAFSSLLSLNFLLIASGSSSAVPFGTILALLAMWALILLPLVFFGAWVGNMRAVKDYPCRTNMIARQIPAQPWYLKPLARFHFISP